MKKIVCFKASIAILTSMLCSYSAVYADASCCGKKSKQYETRVEKTSVNQEKTAMQTRQKTASGLEYTIIVEGTENISPKPGAMVTVDYTGWLKNDNQRENYTYGEYADKNKAFDSSIKRGQKFKFQIGVGQVIKGWDEGVMGMKIGEKRRLYIPASLGYGARGAGGAIPPHADLVFDVELFDVSK